MTFSYETGGDLSNGGSFLSEEGIFHVLITAINERPTKKDGSLIDNAAFKIDLAILDGTAQGQKDKVADICFFHPKPQQKGEGAFAKKKFDRFFLAVSAATQAQLENKGTKLNIDLASLVSRQFVGRFVTDDDAKRIVLSFTDMWHVDDKAVEKVPKCKDSLGLLPSDQRRIGSRQQGPESQAPAPANAAGSVDYSDL